MANAEHLKILKRGVKFWNEWRITNPNIEPDLRDADLSESDLSRIDLKNANLSGSDLMDIDLMGADLSNANCSKAYLHFADLSEAHLCGANLSAADLSEADLGDANLSGAYLRGADLSGANLHGADLRGADISGGNLEYADLSEADLSGANLNGVNLNGAQLIDTDLRKATLTGCSVFGVSAWGVKLEGASQEDLSIVPRGEPAIKVDNLEVAQFVYLLLNNEKIRDVINTVGKKGVLILGRFTPDRKAVLDALREELRRLGYVPMLFDFEKPTDKDFTETIMTLAGLSLFIIADITNPKSSPLELQAAVPNYMTPFVPIIEENEEPFSMFKDLRGKFDWILDRLEYDSATNLIQVLEKAVVEPALRKHDELMVRKAQKLQKRHVREYLKES